MSSLGRRSGPGLALELARICFGLTEILAPRRLASVVGCTPSARTVTIMRVLGARHVLQGVLLIAVDTPAARRFGATVDALHAASLGPIGARADGDDRRLAKLDGIVASGLAGLERRLG